MKIIYSKHLKERLLLRSIPTGLPEKIFKEADERYFDEEAGINVAIKRCFLVEKERDMMVAYRVTGGDVKLITIHPLKEGQKENRVKSGRWRKI